MLHTASYPDHLLTLSPLSCDVVRLFPHADKAEECEVAGPNTRKESPDINKALSRVRVASPR
jgi:hypothetical protein